MSQLDQETGQFLSCPSFHHTPSVCGKDSADMVPGSRSCTIVDLIEEWVTQPGSRWVVLAGERRTAKSRVLQWLAARAAQRLTPFVWWKWPENHYRDPRSWAAVPRAAERLWLLDEWTPWPAETWPRLTSGVLAIEWSLLTREEGLPHADWWPFRPDSAVLWVTLRRAEGGAVQWSAVGPDGALVAQGQDDVPVVALDSRLGQTTGPWNVVYAWPPLER